MSKHGNHPFEWMAKGVKGTHRNPWKVFSFGLPTFSRFARCFVGYGKDTYFGKDRWVGHSSLCSSLPHLYHLSFSKNCMISNFFVRSNNSTSFSLGSATI